MTSLSGILTGYIAEAFATLELPKEHARVTVSASGQDAQFQCNGAMPCAKIARKNPRDIAQNIIAVLQEKHGTKVFKELSVGGPGFINIVLDESFIAQHLKCFDMAKGFGIEKSGQDKTMVLDYGGPNVAKALHVGHLRSGVIGETLRRICLHAGYKVIGDIHLGDWGLPMGMIISELELMGHGGDVTMEELVEIYPKASGDCKDNEDRAALAREATKKLQDGNQAYTRIWRQFVDVSIASIKKDFAQLHVSFDEFKGESDAHKYIADMVKDLQDRGIAYEDEGAWIIDVAKEDDKKKIPPLILLKSDGAVLYSTTDIATIIDRITCHNPNKIVYVVDQRQNLHFEQVFRAVRKAGIINKNIDLTHAGFGTMNGADGKPFKTRDGGVMRLDDLITMAKEKAYTRLDEAALAKDMSDIERDDIAHKIGIAALKFADLQNNRIADYVFDIDRMTSFEGKTGPYLLYQTVRIKSLLHKAKVKAKETIECKAYPINEQTRTLTLLLAEYPDHFANALKTYTPHILCDYAYHLAQEFSSFYGNCHILSETNEDLKNGYLALCQRTHAQLTEILDLLAIEIPERM